MDSFEALVATFMAMFKESQGQLSLEDRRLLFEKIRITVVDGMKILPEVSVEAQKIAIGVIVALGLCGCIARMFTPRNSQQRLYLDDAFLTLVLGCLCTVAGVVYHANHYPDLRLAPRAAQPNQSTYSEVDDLQKRVYPLVAWIWTSTFAVKLCFLALMRPFISHISWPVKWYYWFVVAFCTISWTYVVSNPFIMCRYYGLNSTECFSSTLNELQALAIGVWMTVMDVLSNIMVYSIPTIVFCHWILSQSTKSGWLVVVCLSMFLCLSIFLLIFILSCLSVFAFTAALILLESVVEN